MPHTHPDIKGAVSPDHSPQLRSSGVRVTPYIDLIRVML